MSWLERFKAKETAVETRIPDNSFVCIRLDGHNFKAFTKNFVRPYDVTFSDTMDRVAEYLCTKITGAMFAYVQSDEISIVFSDLKSAETQLWFGGRVQKMTTIASAHATAMYMRTTPTELFPIFDARVFVLDDLSEVVDYVKWRRGDATKNAITMAANTLFSHKFLMGKTTAERRELLVGTDLETLPEAFLYGRLVTKEYKVKTVSHMDKRSQEMHTFEVPRGVWVTEPATDDALTKIVHPVDVVEPSAIQL